MKRGIWLLLSLVAVGPIGAQTRSGTRIEGGGTRGSASITVAPPRDGKTVVTRITYMALTRKRQWISVDGRSILAELVAFDLGDEATFTPPTVIKDEKIRLLKDGKEFIYSIDKLDPTHQDEVLALEDRIKTSYAARKKAAGGARTGKGGD